jgi:hypothetical protein
MIRFTTVQQPIEGGPKLHANCHNCIANMTRNSIS